MKTEISLCGLEPGTERENAEPDASFSPKRQKRKGENGEKNEQKKKVHGGSMAKADILKCHGGAAAFILVWIFPTSRGAKKRLTRKILRGSYVGLMDLLSFRT